MNALALFVTAAMMAGLLFWLGTLVGAVRLRGHRPRHDPRPKSPTQGSRAVPPKRTPIPTVVLAQLRHQEEAPVSGR